MKELISYEQFGKLRMKQFAPANVKVFEGDGPDFEWMGASWISDSVGFTHISRREHTPNEAGGLEIAFSELPTAAIEAILDAIHLPLRPGMSLQQIQSMLGEPENEEVFVPYRTTYDFTVGTQFPYLVSTTVHENKGLIHVSVIRKDVLSGIQDDS